MLSAVSAIRSLKPKSEVPCVVVTREDIRQFLVGMIEEKLPPEKVKKEEIVYKALGVIPDAFDYQKGIVDLYVGQIGGYYDPEKKHFVMADWIPEAVQAEVAAHELTHALQDQYYNLEEMLDPKQENGDMLLAYAALVEGDAMLVMTDRLRAQNGKGSLCEESNVDDLVQEQERMMLSGAKDDQHAIPETLQKIIHFPYTAGVRFSHTLLRDRKGYQGIDASFKAPPRSTREILHPELYLNSDAPQVSIPSTDQFTSEHKGLEMSYSDTLGEFVIQATLCSSTHGSKNCKEAARGWLGDRVVIFQGEGAQREVLWVVNWETSKDAQEFVSAYKKVLEERYHATFNAEQAMALKASGKSVKIEVGGSVVRIRVSS